MPTILNTEAVEGGTMVVNWAFVDEDGNSATPDSMAWSLSDEAGNIINSREAVALTPAAAVDIVLSGADLALDGGTPGKYYKRILSLAATYDSAAGSSLPYREEVAFKIFKRVL